MENSPQQRFGLRHSLLAAFAALIPACTPAKTASPAPQVSMILVHGALTDPSVWSAVTKSLQSEGYTVLAPAMPLRGLSADVAYLSSYLASIPTPVMLVAHSAGTKSASVGEPKNGNLAVRWMPTPSNWLRSGVSARDAPQPVIFSCEPISELRIGERNSEAGAKGNLCCR